MKSGTNLPTYSLRLHEPRPRQPVWDVSFRIRGRQLKRRVGRAWIRRRAPCPDGAFTEGAAHDRARELIAELVAAARESPPAGPTFREVAHGYLDWLERVRGAKPSTLVDHRTHLAEPGERMSGRIMAAIGDRPAAEVTPAEVERFLESIEAAGGGPRTVNKNRALVHAVFEYGVKRAALTTNPARGTDRRREKQRDALQTYTVAEVEALAEALAAGAHRAHGARNDAERAEDAQDAELVRVAAYTGLRQGELRALRWRDVEKGVITVSRAVSAEQLTGTKGRQVRHVPLVPQAARALARLKQRGDFTAPGELVFCTWRGRPLDKSALVARFKRARDAADLRPLRFHDLRHTYGSLLAQAGVDVLSIKNAMGHSDLQTTQRYLHARQASEQVERFARAFED
jgi:integrase